MKNIITLFFCTLAYLSTQAQDWERFVNRSPKGMQAFYVKSNGNEDMLPTEAQYQPLNSKKRIDLVFVKKGGDNGTTENNYAIFKNPTTGENYKLFSLFTGMGGAAEMPKVGMMEFGVEFTFGFNTERIYIAAPPMVAYAYYGNNSIPIAQPITATPCEQQDGNAVWKCTGNIPVTKAACSLAYDAEKNTVTLTTPKGTKVFTKIGE
jgi:hypothetical protein